MGTFDLVPTASIPSPLQENTAMCNCVHDQIEVKHPGGHIVLTYARDVFDVDPPHSLTETGEPGMDLPDLGLLPLDQLMDNLGQECKRGI